MTARRTVRVGRGFFADLDRSLPEHRGPNGEASAADFLALDLHAVVEEFAGGFDRLPEAERGLSAIRVLVASGYSMYAFAVYGMLVDDDSVELIGVDFDLR